MQQTQSVSVQLFRATKVMFNRIGLRSIPRMTAFKAGNAPAFASNGSVVAWRDGVVVEVDGGGVNVFLNRTTALVRTVLAQIDLLP